MAAAQTGIISKSACAKANLLNDKSLTQAETAYQGLRQSILDCELEPSTKIKANAVCQRFGVSLGAAREALAQLVSDGLVTTTAQKGCMVAPVSWREFEELNEVRAEIEVSCLRKSIQNGDLKWEGEVAGALYHLTRLHDEGFDAGSLQLRSDWQQAHVEFHRALVARCPNCCLLDLRDTLFERSLRYRQWSVGLRLATSPRDVRQEHIDLATLAQSRDIDGACVAIEEHVRKSTRALLDAAKSVDGGASSQLSLAKNLSRSPSRKAQS